MTLSSSGVSRSCEENQLYSDLEILPGKVDTDASVNNTLAMSY